MESLSKRRPDRVEDLQGPGQVWRTLMVAEKRFRRLNAPHLLTAVYAQHHRDNKTTIDSGKKLAA